MAASWKNSAPWISNSGEYKLDMPVDATIYMHSLSYDHANDLWSYVDIHTILICVQTCNQMYILDDKLSYIHCRTCMNNL